MGTKTNWDKQGLHAYDVKEANNLALAQLGSVYLSDTNMHYGRYSAIYCVTDTVFNTLTQLTPNRANGVAFSSGGTDELLVGDIILGDTSGAKALVQSITVSSGSWAGGDAAGTIQVHPLNSTEFTASEVIKRISKEGYVITANICNLASEANGGIMTGDTITGVTFYGGTTIFGIFTAIKLTSGSVLAYKG